MDPDACLKRILDHITSHEWDEAYEACEDLYNWLKKGGFAPTVAGPLYIGLSDGSGVAFAILSRPDRPLAEHETAAVADANGRTYSTVFCRDERKRDMSHTWWDTESFPLPKPAAK